jgi:hypothetical protein
MNKPTTANPLSATWTVPDFPIHLRRAFMAHAKIRGVNGPVLLAQVLTNWLEQQASRATALNQR